MKKEKKQKFTKGQKVIDVTGCRDKIEKYRRNCGNLRLSDMNRVTGSGQEASTFKQMQFTIDILENYDEKDKRPYCIKQKEKNNKIIDTLINSNMFDFQELSELFDGTKVK